MRGATGLVAGKPGDGADRAWGEEEAIAVARLAPRRMRLASCVSSAMPEQLSLASEGWQIWAESSNSSSVSPRWTVFAVGEEPSFRLESMQTSYSPVRQRIEGVLASCKNPSARHNRRCGRG